MALLTDAQHDALKRLQRKHGRVETAPGLAQDGRWKVVLPGAEPIRRRIRYITRTGIVERP